MVSLYQSLGIQILFLFLQHLLVLASDMEQFVQGTVQTQSRKIDLTPVHSPFNYEIRNTSG